ncbi:hypothetical protein D3C72_2269090 [compost metagenome]
MCVAGRGIGSSSRKDFHSLSNSLGLGISSAWITAYKIIILVCITIFGFVCLYLLVPLLKIVNKSLEKLHSTDGVVRFGTLYD